MPELNLEDRLGPVNIGRDYGIGNVVEGGVYSSLLVGLGIVATKTVNSLASLVEASFGAYSTGLLYNTTFLFLTTTFGTAHGLGEPGTNEKIASGIGLGATMAYSIYHTLDTAYQGLSFSSYLFQTFAGNYLLGATVLTQAALPFLIIFGAGYGLGKLIRKISGRSTRITRRTR